MKSKIDFFALKRKLAAGLIFLAILTVVLLPLRAQQAGVWIEGEVPEELKLSAEAINAAESLTLDEATKVALARYLGIQISRYQDQSEQLEVQAAKSIYDTKISLSGDYRNEESQKASIVLGSREVEGSVAASLEKMLPTGTNLKTEFMTVRNSTDTSFSSLNPNYQSALEFSVEQPLLKNFFGMNDRKRIRQVKLNVEKFRYEKLDEIEEAVSEARSQYWDLVFAYKNLEARQKALKKAQDFLAIAKDKLDIGLTEGPDVFAAEANVRKRAMEVREAITVVYSASFGMKIFLSTPEVTLIRPEAELHFEPKKMSYDEELKLAYESRRDLKQMMLELESQGIELKIAKNSMLPELNFEGRFAGTSLDRDMASSQGEVFAFNHPRYIAGARFSSPLELRAERSRLGQAKFDLKAAEKELELLRFNIARETDQEYRRLKLRAYQVQQSQTILELERKKLEEEEKNFNQGRSGSNIIIDYQEDLIQAEIESIAALIGYFKAADQFDRTQNLLLERSGVAEGSQSEFFQDDLERAEKEQRKA